MGRTSWKPAVEGAVVGTLTALDGRGAFVDYPANPGSRALAARSTVTLTPAHVGRDVLLVFEEHDAARPIVVGVLQGPAPESRAVQIDGDVVTIAASRELVLRCGRASITLTRAGKVVLRGTYISSRSSGVNRVRGGSVQIN
jgi:Domain of unknown function (DUF6484)